MRNIDKGIICFLFFMLAPWSNYAQTGQLRFEHLTVNQGLSHHVIYDMLQDRQGYIWFATENGLNKYDGYTLTTYKKTPGDTNSIVGNSVIQLMEDNEGYIWMGMMGQGICKFDRHTETFTCYGPNPHTLTQGTVFAMGEDREGYLWVSNREAELRRFDKKTGQYSRFNYAVLLGSTAANGTFVVPKINAVYRDKTGTVWVGSENGLHRMNLTPTGTGKSAPVSFTTYQHDPASARSLTNNQVREIYEDHAGLLWVLTDNGLNRFARKNGTFTPYPYNLNPSPLINASINKKLSYLVEDQQGKLWMGMGTGNTEGTGGLTRFDPERAQFTTVLHNPADPSSLSGNFVRALLVDRSGLLWVSIWGEGVDKANPSQQPFQHYRPLYARPHSLSNRYVDAILEDKSGIIWIATGDGLDRMNKRTGTFTHYRHDPRKPASLPGHYVAALFEDRDGNFWVGSEGELFLFNRQTGDFTSFSQDTIHHPGLNGNSKIVTISQDRQGLLWLGTTNGIKSFDKKTGKVVQYARNPQQPKGISDNFTTALLEDNRGNLWVGTESVALNRLDRKSGRFTHYRPDSHKPGSLTSDKVLCLFQDSKGNLWIGTSGGGLCRFDYEKETFQVFTQTDGLADNSIFSIEEDNKGQLWLGTAKGISRFSFANKTFSNYDTRDGLLSNGFRHAHAKGKDGTLYFGGDNGFIAFDPRQLTTNRYSPSVVITQVKLFDKPLLGAEGDRKIDVNYDENFFSFEFAALNYNNPSKNQYAYQLAGLEKDWVYCGTRRLASYTNLEPGTYTFRVKGSNNDGVWNEKGVSIQVIIHPPWWQTIWFRLLVAIGLFLMAGVSIRLYTQGKLRRQRTNLKRVLQAQEEERQRLAADLHDDLGATLSAIKGHLGTIHQLDNELTYPIKLMERAIRDLRHISHNLMPPEFGKLGLTEAIRETVKRVEAGSELQFLFITYGEERRLAHETELIIYRIATELINNAIKHAKASQVTIQLIFYPYYVSLLVEDDGRGYPAAERTNQDGIGLRNIRSRVTWLKSTLLVDSGERGTTITLDVPL